MRRSKGSTSRKPHVAKPDSAPTLSLGEQKIKIVGFSSSEIGDPLSIKLIFKEELCRLIGASYTSIYSWMRRNEFPRPIVLSPASGRSCRVAWLGAEIQQWLATRPRREIKPPSQ
jgi:predicted DNA-binding transcriptional regulator AlpA